MQNGYNFPRTHKTIAHQYIRRRERILVTQRKRWEGRYAMVICHRKFTFFYFIALKYTGSLIVAPKVHPILIFNTSYRVCS